MSVRAKFKVSKIEITGNTTDERELGTVHLSPVTGGSEENKKFYNYTPCGGMTLGTLNAEALKQFKVGKEYYVDFTPAEPAVQSAA